MAVADDLRGLRADLEQLRKDVDELMAERTVNQAIRSRRALVLGRAHAWALIALQLAVLAVAMRGR